MAKVELRLRDLFKDIELTDDMKSEIIGTVIKDEDGKIHGHVIAVDMDNDIAYCNLYDGPLADKIKNNYKHEVTINV